MLRWTGESRCLGRASLLRPAAPVHRSAPEGQRLRRKTGIPFASNTISLTESSSSLTIAKRVLIDGSVLPVSICEIRLGETLQPPGELAQPDVLLLAGFSKR